MSATQVSWTVLTFASSADDQRLRATGRRYSAWTGFHIPSVESVRHQLVCRRGMRRDCGTQGSAVAELAEPAGGGAEF
jgi:hypothetical protein